MQWVTSVASFHHPLLDETGQDAGRKQPGDVWFLGGTFGGHARRTITVPAGRPIFAPAFCMWSSDPIDPNDFEKAFGTVEVDGILAEMVSTSSGPTTVRGTLLNPVSFWPGPRTFDVFGLWATVPPLTSGTHSVEIRGGDGFAFEVSVDAEIHVA